MFQRWGDLCLLIDRRMKQERSTPGPFPIDEAIHLMLSIVEDMDTLHNKHDILHRDLKASNVLVWGELGEDMSLIATSNPVSKIGSLVADFECSVGVLGTKFWRAPEILEQLKDRVPSLKVQFTRASDVYSYGMTCYEIVTGCIPYDGHGDKDTISQILQGRRPKLLSELPEFVRTMIVGCWHSDPSKRPTFSAICMALKLKRGLNHTGRLTRLQPCVRPLRILVLGNAKLVEATCMSICGTSRHFTEDHVLLKESVSISPPMCLYRVETRSKADPMGYTDIMSFVKARNKRWDQVNLKAAWRKDLYYSREDSTPFPNSSSRLHMVWYVCESRDDLPSALQWEDITKKLNGVPVQMLVTETNEYENILLWKQRFFDSSQRVEDSIIEVDLKDAEAKDRLWQTCWEVKTKAEIRNAATIIGYIREQLGSSGIVIPIGIGARKSKEFSVGWSKDFILNFLCSYWDVPPSFVEVLPSMTNPQEATKFVPFCLQDAATILYREREHIHGLVPAEASAEFVLREAQACAEAYFANLDFNACDKMKSGDIQGFLEAVFENRVVPKPLVSGLDRRWKVLKFIGRLLGKGHVP